MIEPSRVATRQAIGVGGLLPRSLYRYEIALDRVLDLTSEEVRSNMGLDLTLLTGPDWAACQELGDTVHSLGVQGISTPSATGIGAVLAVFTQHAALGHLVPQLVGEWRSSEDILR